ncbi:MAG: S24 family peptidase [bacterium]|nr:S24 family peptidase [bacterium]
MELYERIISKDEINSRAVDALLAIIANGLVATKSDLAECLGAKPSKFSEILNYRMKVGVDIIAKICDWYYVDPDWLLMGRGNKIFKNGTQRKPYFIEDDNNLDRKWHNEEESEPKPAKKIREGSHEGIPLIPLSAMAGVMTDERTVLEYECERYVVPAFKGADFIIPVKGDSMCPTYHSGDLIACKRVPMGDLFFQWNKAYVLDTKQGPLVKRIKPGSDDMHVMIVSDNKTYDPFELPRSAINSVAMVMGIIRLE